MARLLHISSSPRGGDSESLRIAEVFTSAYEETHPGDLVQHWDLWDGSLPDFAVGARAKMSVFGGHAPAGAEAEAWAAARRVFERFDSADRLLFSVPMWNAGIPYVLKQFIDVVSQPGWVFGVDPDTGYDHLLAGRRKRVAVVYTSAVWGPHLGPDFGSDFQSTYFTDWLRWTGLTDISDIRYHPTLTGDRDMARQAADAVARDVAKSF
ncbi:FMN-dependent NADH-azoreductase [Geodermatophilus obscurus]|uniref:FMN dependent NADH:quinone oxidoreductase n=1 Tax=Geodermatophilus obscurus (strain ATCC 25078 / DSM 43160 / JCM 3152 / CCUG 61914 / KCC A-0152 / KCTC 9177 / NBRC 13315 / NRRL B-3577 / G-20) TaxID=526225 RepID=D2SDP5_GEOOG|nr:NAD(P)H-dependent oxidoreductase [Geodermatophilus obscurus]ADB74498.1 NAD(P)H dehydrogenase (quinone) [Geodermatophilus obscurus DSM 43160]